MGGCKHMDSCPCVDVWCRLNGKSEEGCIARLQNAYHLVLEKLSGYEKTGLTPDQIVEMDRLYREKCEEVAALTDDGR